MVQYNIPVLANQCSSVVCSSSGLKRKEKSRGKNQIGCLFRMVES